MQPMTEQKPASFTDRRQSVLEGRPQVTERRQFSNSHSSIRPDVTELAEAIDQYKLRHRRRFITFEELFDVISDLGYHK
jgi:hypothetical protein